MKLRNKQTGEIVDFGYLQTDHVAPLVLTIYKNDKPEMYKYKSLAELDSEWEDYEEPKGAWAVGEFGELYEVSGLAINRIEELKSIGNYFETEEEAEKAVEKLKAWKRLKDKGISFEGKVIDRKWYLEPKSDPQQRTFDEAHDLFKDVKIIFGGEE